MAGRAGSRWRAWQGEIIVMRGRRRRCETALNGCGPVAQLAPATDTDPEHGAALRERAPGNAADGTVIEPSARRRSGAGHELPQEMASSTADSTAGVLHRARRATE